MASAKEKLEAVTTVKEPPDVANFADSDLQLWTYGLNYKPIDTWQFGSQMTDLRVLLDITQASTVEIDLEDSDFEILNDPLFAHWAWDIQNVADSTTAADQTKSFTPTPVLGIDTTGAYLGDSADLEWVLGQKPIDFALGSKYSVDSILFFRLCGIQTQQTTLTLTLEDRVASWLRDKSGAKSWDRSQHTRAQFVAMLCREAGVDYFIPELNVVQPVEADTSTSTSTNIPSVGSGADFGFTARGKTMFTSGQQTFIQELSAKTALDGGVVAAWVYAEENGTAAQARQASGNHNWLNIGYFDSGTGQIAFDSAFKDPKTAADQTAKFLTGKWGGASSGIQAIMNTAGQSANAEISAIQRSGWASSHYPSLPQIYSLITGTAVKNGSIPAATAAGTASNTASYAFTRGPNETSWDCILRLASDVAWYAFARQNRLWFVSGNYLFSQKPQLTIERGKNGVDYIDLDLDMGARDGIAECQVYCRSGMWTALPGMVVQVVNRGPASGKWIVSAVENHPRDATQECVITLQKPVPKRAEPTAGSSTSTNTTASPNAPKTVDAAYAAAVQLSAKHLVYTEASRTLKHLNQISQGETLYDCSASVSWVLLSGGFALPGGKTWGDWAPVSGDFVPGQAGLVAGQGKNMTIWACSTHVFIEFNIPGHHSQGNTVNPYGSGFGLFSWNAPGCVPDGGPTPGSKYQPVHYPGT